MGNISQIKLQHTILGNILSNFKKLEKLFPNNFLRCEITTTQLNPRLIMTTRTPVQTFCICYRFILCLQPSGKSTSNRRRV